jgi:hypothetical protein
MADSYQKKELLALMATGQNKRELIGTHTPQKLIAQSVSTAMPHLHNGLVSATEHSSVSSARVSIEVCRITIGYGRGCLGLRLISRLRSPHLVRPLHHNGQMVRGPAQEDEGKSRDAYALYWPDTL